jgi:hypothetical protein
MNRTFLIVMLLMTGVFFSACSSEEEAVEEEVSHVTNEGPYGGHSVKWYKMHWNTKTADQRTWCRLHKKEAEQMQSCIDANTGWKQGRADPKTNPPRKWEDGPKPVYPGEGS